ncbi:5'-nucleotidase C-terminal domain-containing protein [Candidatus Margulisiibacteriota bacterium]
MKKLLKTYLSSIILILGLALFLTSCGLTSEAERIPIAIGQVTTPLDMNKTTVRLGEAIVGNLICDATKSYADNNSYTINFVLLNAGSFRFNETDQPDGIYPSGNFTDVMLEEILPFGNALSIVQVTGQELKSVFEHAVSAMPDDKGYFMQMSEGISITIDSSKQAQELNVSENAVETAGERIVSINIANNPYVATASYTFATNSYIASGADGFVTLPTANITTSSVLISDAVTWYFGEQTGAVTPVATGNRIILQ